MTPALEAPRYLVEYRGRRLLNLSQSQTLLRVEDDAGPFPDAAERGESNGRRWVRVPFTGVTRTYRTLVHATYDGEQVEVTSVGDQVGFTHGRDPAWARRHELQGSQHEGGWHGYAPRDALSDIRVTELDLRMPKPPDARG